MWKGEISTAAARKIDMEFLFIFNSFKKDARCNERRNKKYYTGPGLFIFVFLKFSGVFPKLRSRKLPNLRVTWHFSLVQRRLKNGQTLTVKGMVKSGRISILKLQSFPHDTQEVHGCIGIP
jgi:hypothetical protein